MARIKLIDMPYLICYDITKNKKRNRIAKQLQASGFSRIQKSVFFGYISHTGLQSLEKELQKLLSPRRAPNDKLYIIKVQQTAFYKMKQLGAGIDPVLLLGRERVLII